MLELHVQYSIMLWCFFSSSLTFFCFCFSLAGEAANALSYVLLQRAYVTPTAAIIASIVVVRRFAGWIFRSAWIIIFWKKLCPYFLRPRKYIDEGGLIESGCVCVAVLYLDGVSILCIWCVTAVVLFIYIFLMSYLVPIASHLDKGYWNDDLSRGRWTTKARVSG